MDERRLLIPYRLRAVRIGIQATLPAVLLLAVYAWLPDVEVPNRGAYVAVLGVALGAVGIVAAAPWRRLFETRAGDLALLTWSVGDIALVSTLVALSGGTSSPLWAVYVLTTLFFAAAYPVRSQIVLFAFTATAYAIACATAGPVAVAPLVLRVGVLALLVFMASFLSRELMVEMSEHRGARRSADRRAQLLSRIAEAAGTVHALEPQAVFDAVTRTCIAIGFDRAGIVEIDASTDGHRVISRRGGDVFGDRVSEELLEQVVRTGATAVVDAARPIDVPTGPVAPKPTATTLVAAPVLQDGQTVAVVAAAREEPVRVTTDEIDGFELLASVATSALDNAARYAAERQTVERLERLDELKRDFVSTVSHELRTPLTVIYGMGRTLSQRWRDLTESQRHSAVDRMVVNASSLHRTIAALLDFSRLESGQLDASLERMDVSTFVEEQVDRLRDAVAPRQLTTEVDEGVAVDADPTLLERVLENLLVNAATHTPETTHVRVIARQVDGRVTIDVRDDGPGIPPDELVHLTDRFFRGGDPNRRPVRGLGLGLALVSEILDLHGTELEIESAVGRGSRFGFELDAAPRVVASSPAAHA